MIVFLDSGVLGVLSSSQKTDIVSQCKQWFYQLLARGIYVISSELCDYEVRRSLLLNKIKNLLATQSLNNLDELQKIIEFLLLTTPVIRQAAQLWAETRSQGLPTADVENIDIDVIIGATCRLLQQEYPGRSLIVATTNVKHLTRFAEAITWQKIKV